MKVFEGLWPQTCIIWPMSYFFYKPEGPLTLTKRFAICVPDEVYSVTAEMARSSMVSVPERAATGSRSTA